MVEDSARMLSEVYGTWFVIPVSVCPPVCCLVSAATRNKTAKKRYQRVQYRTDFIFNSEVMARKPSEQANILISTGLPRPGPLALRTLEAQEVTTKGVYRLPHAIYCFS